MIFNNVSMVFHGFPWFPKIFSWFSMIFLCSLNVFFVSPTEFLWFSIICNDLKNHRFFKDFSMHCQWFFDDASKIFWDFPKMFNDFSMMFHWCFNDISESFQESLQDTYGTLTGPEAINPFSNLNILAVKL